MKEKIYLLGFRDEDGQHWVTDITGGSVSLLNRPNDLDPDEGWEGPMQLHDEKMAYAIAILNRWSLYAAFWELDATGDYASITDVRMVLLYGKKQCREIMENAIALSMNHLSRLEVK